MREPFLNDRPDICRRTYRLEPYLPNLEERVQQGCENASLLWQEICRQGFTHGYKVVNTWLREYLAKPGRNSSAQEKAKHQAFLDAVQAAQGGVLLLEEMVLNTPIRGENAPVVVEPLESPRHLTWLLLRDPVLHDGQPALAPWRLAMVTIMRFIEGLSDRQAADAVRSHLDWKYALSLELEDSGFDFSVLSEFRSRLIEGNAEHVMFETGAFLVGDIIKIELAVEGVR